MILKKNKTARISLKVQRDKKYKSDKFFVMYSKLLKVASRKPLSITTIEVIWKFAFILMRFKSRKLPFSTVKPRVH